MALRLPPLPALETPLEELRPIFSGPTACSNWVVPGVLMAGDRRSLDSQEGLYAVCKAVLGSGAGTIVCLQSRQEMASSVHYRKRAESLHLDVQFHEQPIPDQEVIDDGLVELLLEELLQRLTQGQVLYVHCRGGHGRTNTICALLLGRLYGLSAREAVIRAQRCHDTRSMPVFSSPLQPLLADHRSCSVLFPVQLQQVERLLLASEADQQSSSTAAFVVPQPAPLERGRSLVYGSGASAYSEQDLQAWQAAAGAAAERLNAAAAARKRGAAAESKEGLREAATLFRRAADVRPDFPRGWLGLARALKHLGKEGEAKAELLRALEHCPGDASILEELTKLDQVASSSSTAPVQAQGSIEAAPCGGHVAEPSPSWRPRIAEPKFILLVGLPGSGKSTFSKQLEKSGHHWVRLCQDELPGRDALESALGHIVKDPRKQVILDRCNERSEDRKAFLDLAFQPQEAVCVHFDMAAADCEARAAQRTDHPTIKFGGGRNAVRSKAQAFQAPRCEEGFAEVIRLCSFQDANHLLTCWGAQPPEVLPMGFFKFPTTPHVLDLTEGRCLTESDRLLQPFEAARFFDGKTVVVVEEKVDGANCGISLTEDYEPRFQNRAHYVTSSTAGQWQALDSWWDEHGWAVCQLLEPEVEVLFGEWLWARHSVAYTKLPGYFVAFDIYDKRKGLFCSARERDRRLEGLEIPIAPRVAERAFEGQVDLLSLMQRPSSYGDGAMEGIYLRIDEPEEKGGGLWLQQRGKIVRADFIQGIADEGHWTHRELQRNRLDF